MEDKPNRFIDHLWISKTMVWEMDGYYRFFRMPILNLSPGKSQTWHGMVQPLVVKPMMSFTFWGKHGHHGLVKIC